MPSAVYRNDVPLTTGTGMSRVALNITMSLDGFVTVPNDGPSPGRILGSPYATHIDFRVKR